jgi:ribosomal protein S18 acetylase RimI-like enzyme
MKKKKVAHSKLINIRTMTIDDVAPAFHLGEQLFTLRKTPNLYRVWDEYEIIDFYHNNADFCLSAFYGKTFVGFLLGTIIEKRQSKRKYGYLVWLAVDPEWKGQGIATALYEEFKKRTIEEEVKVLMVDTQANNLEALDFFYQRGFGYPEQHVYLSLYLDEEKNKQKEMK